MDTVSKKELLAQYKTRKQCGGVFVTRNTVTGQQLLECAVDLQGSKNRFTFSRKTESCISSRLQKDWEKYGSSAFSFETLEELVRGDTQTDAEFKEDILLLLEVWREKLADQNLY